jgi:DNA polymerase-1
MSCDLVSEIDAQYGVFIGREVNAALFEAYLARNDIPWPRLASGRLEMSDDVFKVMSEIYPILAPLRQARQAASAMRLSGLVVGSDGRNRCWLNPFGALTGRNQPSNRDFIFGPATWMRSFIKPEEGFGIAYIDISCAEAGIAAKLSDDPVMLADYRDDMHLGLGKKAGIVPPNATKKTHGRERDALKPCNLGLLYVMGPKTLATRLAGFDTPYPDSLAAYLWQTHHQSYEKFWRWSDACVDHAMLLDFLQTPLGWRMTTKLDINPNTLRNFPVQGTCADILRLACCFGVRRGIKIAAPVHDACLINAPLDRFDEDVATMRACFAEASRIVLDGFELKTGVEFFPLNLWTRAESTCGTASKNLWTSWMGDVFDKRKRFVADFVKLPMVWVKGLENAKLAATWRLAVFLLYRTWRQPGERITVSNVAVAAWGITRRRKCGALQELENLGLTQVERCGNHSPVVKLKM